MIGVYDSGLGGILELDKIHRDNPKSDIVYLGDQKNAPYGLKSDAELVKIYDHNVAMFKTLGIKHLILACNTLCSTIDLKKDQAIETYDLISHTVERINFQNIKKVAVFATRQTILKKRYQRLLKEKGLKVRGVALDDLAKMLEDFEDLKKIETYLIRIFDSLEDDFDAIILGCTHYPIVKDIFKEYYQCPIFDSRNLDFNLKLNERECGNIYIMMREDEKNRQFVSKYVSYPIIFVTYEELVDRFGLTSQPPHTR